ncbi:hypothetical protein AGMMS49579_26990 [Spirochaetia bacterium]|nr:hypothetical protein AGMMS49579_26990 [Spirochaetia bacterium]
MGCNTLNIIVEKNEINNFLVEEIHEDNDFYIKISGLIMHSAYVYNKIETNESFDGLNILLYGSFFKKGKGASATFDVKIHIKNNINIVYFGRGQIKIWERNNYE